MKRRIHVSRRGLAANGVINEFKEFFLKEMHGSYFQDDAAEQFCSKITPVKLAELALANDADIIAESTGVHIDWATQICDRLRYYRILHALEIMWKPPCPVIMVLTRAMPPIRIPVNQLSDGQKHTIMLTIAMLAESNIPLVIDQPEDDLDNAFIFQRSCSRIEGDKRKASGHSRHPQCQYRSAWRRRVITPHETQRRWRTDF